jgi:hypothetical protein
MLSLELQQSNPKRSSQQTKLRWDVLFSDLSLFFSLCIARLIVWRVLRRHRVERAARLKRIRLVQKAGPEDSKQLAVETLGEL